MIFYKGTSYSDEELEIIPGFVSSEFEEPCQFMNPGLYAFEFDYNSLIEVDYVNGRDSDPQIRGLKPGARGEEGPSEVLINVPVKMTLVDGYTILGRIVPFLEYQTADYVLHILNENKELYRLTSQDIVAATL